MSANDTGQASQQEALEALLKQPACFVYGVPGCGKTSALTAAINSLDGESLKLTLRHDQGHLEQISVRLGTEVKVLESLPAALAEKADGADVFFVLDDAEQLIQDVSRNTLQRLAESAYPQVHMVIASSTLVENAALRKARSAMPSMALVGSAAAPTTRASKAAWGWSAGAAELAACLGRQGDIPLDCASSAINLVLLDCLEDYVWERLPKQQRSYLLGLSLDWLDEEATPYDEMRNLPALPLTRFEGNRIVFHPAYRLLLEGKLSALDQEEQVRLHSRLARHYLQKGKTEKGAPHALAASDWETVAELDPFELLYSPNHAIADQLTLALASNKEKFDFARLKDARFCLRLAAVQAARNKAEEAWGLLTLAGESLKSDGARREHLVCQLLISPAPSEQSLQTLADLVDAEQKPSTVFSLDDLACLGISRFGNLIQAFGKSRGNQALGECTAALATIFGCDALKSYYQGLVALFACDFYTAKKDLQQALLEAEQRGSLAMQRAALETLVKLDSVQENYSAANRYLSALEMLPYANEQLDRNNLELARTCKQIFEGEVEEVPKWIKGANFEVGLNVVATKRFFAFTLNVLYLLKRRRTTKAFGRVEFLELEENVVRQPQNLGFVLLLKACCYLDFDKDADANTLFQRSAALLDKSGFKLPYAIVSALSSRYRSFLKEHKPAVMELVETSERDVIEQHNLQKQALSKPAEGPMSLLSDREYEVATLAANGYANKEIAAKLFITERTVKEHLTRTYKKLQVADRHSLKEKFLTEHRL